MKLINRAKTIELPSREELMQLHTEITGYDFLDVGRYRGIPDLKLFSMVWGEIESSWADIVDRHKATDEMGEQEEREEFARLVDEESELLDLCKRAGWDWEKVGPDHVAAKSTGLEIAEENQRIAEGIANRMQAEWTEPAGTLPEVEELARTFAESLRESLTDEELAEVNRRNEADPRSWKHEICHSHDFTDSNMDMAAALGEFDLEIDGADEAVTDLCNRAWSMAKDWHFVDGPEDDAPDPLEQNQKRAMALLPTVMKDLTGRDIEAHWEYPGYIGFSVGNGIWFAFGTANGPMEGDYSFESDGSDQKSCPGQIGPGVEPAELAAFIARSAKVVTDAVKQHGRDRAADEVVSTARFHLEAARENARKLEAMGEPYPFVDLSFAAGQDPAELAQTTQAAVDDLGAEGPYSAANYASDEIDGDPAFSWGIWFNSGTEADWVFDSDDLTEEQAIRAVAILNRLVIDEGREVLHKDVTEAVRLATMREGTYQLTLDEEELGRLLQVITAQAEVSEELLDQHLVAKLRGLAENS